MAFCIQNDIHLVKLLLNHNYKKPDEADIELIHYDPDEEDGASKPKFGKRPRGYKRKPFARQGSRRAFTLGRKLADSEDNDAENESDEEEVPRRDTTGRLQYTYTSLLFISYVCIYVYYTAEIFHFYRKSLFKASSSINVAPPP